MGRENVVSEEQVGAERCCDHSNWQFLFFVYMIWQAGALSLDVKVDIFENNSSFGSVPSSLAATIRST